MEGSSIVYIGKKPITRYILACITLFHEGLDKITIKARGRSIERAIDVVESLRKYYMSNIKIHDVRLGSEIIRSVDGEPRRVSTITIYLIRNST